MLCAVHPLAPGKSPTHRCRVQVRAFCLVTVSFWHFTFVAVHDRLGTWSLREGAVRLTGDEDALEAGDEPDPHHGDPVHNDSDHILDVR